MVREAPAGAYPTDVLLLLRTQYLKERLEPGRNFYLNEEKERVRQLYEEELER